MINFFLTIIHSIRIITVHNLQIHCIAMMFRSSNLLFIAGEFGIVYRARLTRSTLRSTDCEIVAVKTAKGMDMIQPWYRDKLHTHKQLAIVCLSYTVVSFPATLPHILAIAFSAELRHVFLTIFNANSSRSIILASHVTVLHKILKSSWLRQYTVETCLYRSAGTEANPDSYISR